MPYSPKAIANEFLNAARAVGESLTPMKVQKLVYFAHGWHLAISGEALVTPSFEAWRWGPVVRPLYAALREFGNQPILSNLQEAVPLAPGVPAWQGYALRDFAVDTFDDGGRQAVAVVRKVWDEYGGYTAVQLSNLTHEPGTPWDVVAKQHNYVLPNTPPIADSLIRDYFRSEARLRSVQPT